MSDAAKSVSVPTFSGREEDYELFWPRFEAYADMKGFAEALDWENPDPDLPVKHDELDSDPDVRKLEEAAIKRNKTAIAAFTLAFQTKASLNMINEAKSVNYPRGLAYLVAKELQQSCNPRDRVAKIEATNALRAVRMKAGSKPSKFFSPCVCFYLVHKSAKARPLPTHPPPLKRLCGPKPTITFAGV